MRQVLFCLYSILIFLLPLVFSRTTNQIFEINKFVFLAILCGLIAIVSAIGLLRASDHSFFERLNFDKNHYYISLAVVLFLLFLGISTWLSVSPVESFWGSYFRHQGLLLYLLVIGLAVIVIMLKPSKQEFINYFLIPLIATGFIQAVILIIQFLFPDYFFTDLILEKYNARSIGTFGQPNMAGRFLLFPFFVLWSFLYISKTTNRIFNYVIVFLLVLIFCGILTTGSRSAMVALFCGVILLLMIEAWQRQKWQKFLLASSIVIVSTIAIFGIFHNDFSKRQDAVEMRLLIWEQAPKAISEHWFFGWGLDMQENALNKIADQQLYVANAGNTLDRAHNEILDFLLQSGVIGLTVYLTMLIVIFVNAWPKARNDYIFKGIFVALLSSLIGRQFEFFSVTDFVYFFFFLILLAFLNFNKSSFVESQKSDKGYFLYISFAGFLIVGVWLINNAFDLHNADRLYFQENYSEAHKISSWNKVYGRMAILMAIKGQQIDEAYNILNDLHFYHPKWAETHYYQAVYQAGFGDLVGAQKAIQEALLLYPANEKYRSFASRIESF